MDKLEQRLRDDAALIRATVSPELDERIRASLEASAAAPRRPARPRPAASLWWASSLTGLAAALALVALVNLWPRGAEPDAGSAMVPAVVAGNDTGPPASPPLRMQTAVLTAPLEEELDSLESDIAKARAAAREDLGL